MKIRPYKSSDFDEIKTWVNTKRIHALWCANLIKYPLEKINFENILKGNNDAPFTAVKGNKIAGFFCYSFNSNAKEIKLKFIILSPEFRGKGYGKELVSLAVKNAFENKAESVQLNVFDNNTQAKNCYLRSGFSERVITENVFCFENEIWDRCNMVIKKSMNKN